MKKYFYFGGLLVILALSVVVFGQTQVFESLRLRGTGTPGTLVVANDKNDAMIILRGSDGQISSGGNGASGKLRIANSQNAFVVSIDGDTGRLSFIGNGGIRFPDGTVQTTAPIQGVSLHRLVQRIQQLEQRLQQVEQRVAALSGGGTSPGRHIAVSKEGAGASTVFVALVK